MNDEPQEKRVYRDREPAFYEHLESLPEAGLSELEENAQRYRVTRGQREDRVRYFDLQPASAP